MSFNVNFSLSSSTGILFSPYATFALDKKSAVRLDDMHAGVTVPGFFGKFWHNGMFLVDTPLHFFVVCAICGMNECTTSGLDRVYLSWKALLREHAVGGAYNTSHVLYFLHAHFFSVLLEKYSRLSFFHLRCFRCQGS